MNFEQSSSSDVLRLTLYLTPAHSCGYFAGRLAATLYVDPGYAMSADTYQFLLNQGFRRSGNQVYRPYCGGCSECIPVRLPVWKFKPGRNFRRVLNKNQELVVTTSPAAFNQERFELYQLYIKDRHGDGPMANPGPDDFISFLECSWGESKFVEFRLDGRLVMVAVMDEQENSFSAVYTYFDPTESARSLGTFAILWQIEEVKRLGKEWLYLGYWVEACKKMRYKSRFKPMEIFQDRKWIELDVNSNIRPR
ncbi:MAG: arginyltransferase [Magnetococcales bacterium]|nr:arginyltransferase [Magnetococcales bacterium]